MSTVPNESIVSAAVSLLGHFALATVEQGLDVLRMWACWSLMTEADIAEVQRQLFPICPDWCSFDHSGDDARDDLVLHQGDDNTDGTVRKLLGAHTLDIRVARTDCPSEDRVGKPALMVRVDAELTTWEQAAELARTILDGFGYLSPAGKP